MFIKRLVKIVIIISVCNGIVFNKIKEGGFCKVCKIDNFEYI